MNDQRSATKHRCNIRSSLEYFPWGSIPEADTPRSVVIQSGTFTACLIGLRSSVGETEIKIPLKELSRFEVPFLFLHISKKQLRTLQSRSVLFLFSPTRFNLALDQAELSGTKIQMLN
jgi:hypothetical protein